MKKQTRLILLLSLVPFLQSCDILESLLGQQSVPVIENPSSEI